MINSARLIEVIETTTRTRGDGKDDPVRVITEYFDKDGKKLAEVDPISNEQRLKDAILWALGENSRGSVEISAWWRKELCGLVKGLALFVGLVLAMSWVGVSAIDREHCEAHGAQYDHTSIGLVSWCRVSGVVVRAEGLGK